MTHLSHVYVEWSNLDGKEDATRCYDVPAEEKEMESLRLEWSYLRGRDDILLSRTLKDVITGGYWVRGMLAELRLRQRAGKESPYGINRQLGPGHVALCCWAVVYVARCGTTDVEIRNHTKCTQEITVTLERKKMFVDPFTLILQ